MGAGGDRHRCSRISRSADRVAISAGPYPPPNPPMRGVPGAGGCKGEVKGEVKGERGAQMGLRSPPARVCSPAESRPIATGGVGGVGGVGGGGIWEGTVGPCRMRPRGTPHGARELKPQWTPLSAASHALAAQIMSGETTCGAHTRETPSRGETASRGGRRRSAAESKSSATPRQTLTFCPAPTGLRLVKNAECAG